MLLEVTARAYSRERRHGSLGEPLADHEALTFARSGENLLKMSCV
jgi:hypothetical protein